ncbi:MAG TPA: hypothetical protein VK789_13695 [Bryobacteraceae bacterium]|jgi:hypothetical protein|nr:hypothetical protein [Bryobacteraceae bacterium]
MCDYSLYEFPNRLAREGEELVTWRFPLGSLGLASPAELQNARTKPPLGGFWETMRVFSERPGSRLSDQLSVCAVCVPPGARLIVKDIPAVMQKEFDLGPDELGKFIETSVDPYRHRDAIQFANGSVIPLQHLREGQRVEVLSLVPADELAAESHTLTF